MMTVMIVTTNNLLLSLLLLIVWLVPKTTARVVKTDNRHHHHLNFHSEATSRLTLRGLEMQVWMLTSNQIMHFLRMNGRYKLMPALKFPHPEANNFQKRWISQWVHFCIVSIIETRLMDLHVTVTCNFWTFLVTNVMTRLTDQRIYRKFEPLQTLSRLSPDPQKGSK